MRIRLKRALGRRLNPLEPPRNASHPRAGTPPPAKVKKLEPAGDTPFVNILSELSSPAKVKKLEPAGDGAVSGQPPPGIPFAAVR